MSIIIKNYKVALILGFTMFSIVISAQQIFSDVHPAIMKFYEYLFKEEKLTISEFNVVYQKANLNTESWLIKEKCNRKEENYCNKLQKIGNVFQNLSLSDTSCVFWEFRTKYYSELTHGLSFGEIITIIKNLTIHYDGDINIQYAILTFPNDKKIYLALNADTENVGFPSKISEIWLNNGDNLSELTIDNVTEKLKWVGIINTKNNKGSIKIYEKPNNSSIVTGQLLLNQTFFFTPIGDNDWWPVYNHGEILGYIQKKDVVMYSNFPKELRDRLEFEH